MNIRFKDFFTKKAKKQESSFFVIWVLTEYVGIYYIFSALLSAIFCSSFNFILNKTVTFHEKIGRNFLSEYFEFWGIALVGGFLGLGLLFSLTEFLGVYYFVSSVFSLMFSGALEFVGNKVLIFRK